MSIIDGNPPCFHYPKSIIQAVFLAETIKLVVKASRRPRWKRNTAETQAKNREAQGQRGGGRSGYFTRCGKSGYKPGTGGRRGRFGERGYVLNRGHGGTRGRGSSTLGSFNPQASFVYGK